MPVHLQWGFPSTPFFFFFFFLLLFPTWYCAFLAVVVAVGVEFRPEKKNGHG